MPYEYPAGTILMHSRYALECMRRRTDATEVGFAARISALDKQSLDAILPMQGGKTWAVETALAHFLDLCEAMPELAQAARDSILRMRDREPPRGDLAELAPRIPVDLYRRFNKLFGDKGGTTWFLREFCFSLIRRVDDRDTIEHDILRSVDDLVQRVRNSEAA
jgi:hypothetical protein